MVLHDALDKLSALDPRKSRIVELKFFGGLTVGEIAEVMQISDADGRSRLELRARVALTTPSAAMLDGRPRRAWTPIAGRA
jgi:DNA-directed RNA polymerase specialized sigma24 family protein